MSKIWTKRLGRVPRGLDATLARFRPRSPFAQDWPPRFPFRRWEGRRAQSISDVNPFVVTMLEQFGGGQTRMAHGVALARSLCQTRAGLPVLKLKCYCTLA